MQVEKTITEYYVNKSKEDKCELAELLASVVGNKHLGLIEKRIKGSIFSLVITAEDIEHNRANSNLNNIEELLLDYFDNKVCCTDSGEYVIGIHNPDNINCESYVNNEHSTMGIVKEGSIIHSYTKIKLFSTKSLNDRLFICSLLLGLSFHGSGNNFSSYYDDIDIDMDETTTKQSYIYFINMLAYKLSKEFHKKGNYIFDEENLVPTIENEIEETFDLYMNRKFYKEFKDLLPMYYSNPNKFINLVGKENYIDYVRYYIERDESIDIDEAVNNMVYRKNNNGDFRISIDIDKIMNLKRYIDINKQNRNEDNE